ncbi:putative sporulation protein YtxC [Gorillibacterium timonense]|uniref:putative sporulation protein YtxC n=1 Tax=Gorillibacterium timonense TaxID=1689269 RepID=UPI00071CF280|nr:putative sporulation protein YtxC [Gorillibacterium timonense]
MDHYLIALMNRSDEKASKLRDKLNQQIGTLAFLVSLEKEAYPRHQLFRCSRIGEAKWTPADRKKIRRELARAVTRYILEDEEETLLREMFIREYRYTAADDLDKLLGYYRLPSEGDEPARKKALAIRQFREISDTIEACLHQNGMVNIEGIMAFRLGSYRKELKETVDYAVDEYLMDKQYQEFISLLKYFVYIQQAKIPSVHVLHRGGSEFELLDDKLEALEPVKAEGGITYETLEKELNFEDLIVSSLITMAPERIYIHTQSPDTQVIRTIRQIFEDRVILCDSIAK